ncbi:hypothetical protein N8I77_001920 [Diaporthe amygdali]|uniref:Uncharacterized protein n=1 Tax=Phomopsis amygdali TaxID=1214568 RepID=A0AAD9SSZ9_PHOAM|nr:hypothetical protein N8I77_001920 [Diaporthe amygdali]
MAAQRVTEATEDLAVDAKTLCNVGDASAEARSVDDRFAANPFSDPAVAEHYRTVYEKAQYECRHAFDPDLEWSKEEERKLVRRLDWHVCTWACIMCFALQVDRDNLGQAVSGNMLDQLNLSTNEYNYGRTIYYISFLLSEVPSQLVSKKFGPDRWIPVQMVIWSAITCTQAGLTGRNGYYATRALLGIFEGGFIPDLVLWLSYFYTSRELPMRLGFFWTANSLTGIATSLLAFALLHMDGIKGLAGWRWLFLIEGLVTCTVGMASFFLMPASAVQTKTWFRPDGWFTDREERIVVNRVLRDDPSKGDMHNRMPITPQRLWRAMTDYDLWPLYAMASVIFIPTNPPEHYLTLTLRELGFDPFVTNLLVIPSTAMGILTLLAITWVSEHIDERGFVSMIQGIWSLPCLLALRFWPGTMTDAWGTYAVVTVLLSFPYCQAIVVGWTSKNSGSVRTRAISASVFSMMKQVGSIASSNIYREDDKPLYRRGNSVLIGINMLAIVLFLFTKCYYVMRNRWKAQRWESMSEGERRDYLEYTKDLGNKRLDFRFAH